MAKVFRMKCPHCGNVVNVPQTGPCPKCGTLLDTNQPAAIAVYRMGNFMGAATGFGIYINNEPYGAIGNRETLILPLPYGSYQMHVVCGMIRRCNDPIIPLSPNDPFVCLKVHMKMGFV